MMRFCEHKKLFANQIPFVGNSALFLFQPKGFSKPDEVMSDIESKQKLNELINSKPI